MIPWPVHFIAVFYVKKVTMPGPKCAHKYDIDIVKNIFENRYFSRCEYKFKAVRCKWSPRFSLIIMNSYGKLENILF